MFSVLQAVVLQDVENCTLNWVLQNYPNPLLCHTKPHVSRCCSLARSAWPKGFSAEGCRQEHLFQVHTAHLQALSQDWPLCGQLYSTHCHLHLDVTWILRICHVQPQNAGQTTLVSMYEWDTWVGSEEVLPTWAALRVPCPSSSGGHPYSKNILWEKREESHSTPGTSYAFHAYLFRKHSCQYALRTTHATPSPPKAGLPEDPHSHGGCSVASLSSAHVCYTTIPVDSASTGCATALSMKEQGVTETLWHVFLCDWF